MVNIHFKIGYNVHYYDSCAFKYPGMHSGLYLPIITLVMLSFELCYGGIIENIAAYFATLTNL